MAKLFFIGMAIFAFVVMGAFSALFSPLMVGVDRNLGGQPRMPFQTHLPAPVVSAMHNAAAQMTPQLMLTAALGLAALLIVYAIGALCGHYVGLFARYRRRWAEARWRARASAARHQQVAAAQTAPSVAASQTKLDALWK